MLSPLKIQKRFDSILIKSIENLLLLSTNLKEMERDENREELIALKMRSLTLDNVPDPSNKKSWNEFYLNNDKVEYLRNLINNKTDYNLRIVVNEEDVPHTYDFFIKFKGNNIKILEKDGLKKSLNKKRNYSSIKHKHSFNKKYY